MTTNVWDSILTRVEAKVDRHCVYTWFKPTSQLRDDGQTLTIRVSDPMVIDWLTRHYAVIIDEALAEVGRAGTHLSFEPDGSIECPLHQGRFDIRTGKALCAPVTEDLAVHEVRIDAGRVQVRLRT